MSETQAPLVSGMALGGVLISTIGALSTVFTEGKKLTVKSVSRDFIIGAIMVAFIIQLLPESSASLIQFALGLVPLTLFKGGASASAVTGGSTVEAAFEAFETFKEDTEIVKVGVPKF